MKAKWRGLPLREGRFTALTEQTGRSSKHVSPPDLPSAALGAELLFVRAESVHALDSLDRSAKRTRINGERNLAYAGEQCSGPFFTMLAEDALQALRIERFVLRTGQY